MPGKNIVKLYSADSYYHVYTRGANKQDVFKDEDDYVVFISLFKRYLSSSAQISTARVPYPNYHSNIDILVYCLMPNHIHLLLHQKEMDDLARFMRSLMTSYSMYFNRKYSHVGPVFQSRYKAILIENDAYYQHISRYIHLNPTNWIDYPYSSLVHYRSHNPPEWLNTKTVLEMFNDNIGEYLTFLRDYIPSKKELASIKKLLADQ